MAGTYDGSLIFDTKVDTQGFKRGTNTLKTQANSIKGSLLNLGKAVGVAFGVTQLIKFGKQAVELASDIQEVQNVVDTAFGDLAYKMEEFAEKSIEMYGISKLTAKQTGSTFMAMASGMGLANETASDMSLQLTALSADMASFYNKSQDATATALKSVFTGETETLKQFGIVMTEANLEAFRLSQGIEESYKSMNQAEKVALRYNFVMNATALAQGDFAKTQNSWANQTRILSERWKEFLSLLGNGLVKVLTPVVQALNLALQYMIGFANAITQLLGGEAEKQEQVANSIGSAVDNQEALTKATKETAKANEKTLTSFDEIQKLTSSASARGETNAGGGSGISFDVSTPYEFEFDTQKAEIGLNNILNSFSSIKNWLEQFKNPFESWFDTDFNTFAETIKNSFLTIFNGVKETITMMFTSLFTTTIPTIINTLLTTILPLFTQIGTQLILTLTAAFNVLNSLFQNIWKTGIKPALDLLVNIWDSAWKTIQEAWGKWGEPIFEKARTMIENVGNVLTNIWNTILLPVWQNIMENVDWLWTKHLQPLMANFLDFVGVLINGALDIYNGFILPVVNWFVNWFGKPIADAFNFVVNIIGTAIATIIDVVSGIITSLKGVVEFVVGIFTGDWQRAWDGIKTYYQGLWEAIAGIVKGAINLIIDFINGMLKVLENGINHVLKLINKLKITNPFTGDDIWSPNVPLVNFPQIPKLATGTVVPANYGNFLAMLGDNTKETEVVSPLSTMKQALTEALAESGQNITIKFEETSIGDLVRLLKPYIDKENRRVGSSMRVGGAY